MSDLISRQALRDAMYHQAFETDTEMQRWDSGCWIRYKLFENVIENLPSAQPEIIRCEDCMYNFEGLFGCDRVTFYNEKDDFCSRAKMERRTDE
jgi:hypothetical protein